MELKEQIAEWLHLLHGGRLVELRAMNVPANGDGTGRRVTVGGYYRDYARCAADALALDEAKAPAVYQTLNVIDEALYARSPDRLTWGAEHTTADRDVVSRAWIFFDIDSGCPAGVGSTDAELEETRKIRSQIIGWLDDCFDNPPMILGCSGNGSHLYLDNDFVGLEELDVRKLYAILHEEFLVGRKQELDQAVFNMARLTKMFGTIVRKGAQVDGRVWRRSFIEGTRNWSIEKWL